MVDRAQQADVRPAQAGEGLGIVAVRLPRALGDEPHAMGVGHDHFVPQALQQARQPRRVRAHFEDDACPGHPLEPSQEGFFGGP